MNRFEDGKRYVFSKGNFLTDSVAATLYKNREGTRNWVNGCDGQEVAVLNERAGIVDECLVHACQCEELIPHMTAIVQEVCQQRYEKGELV